MACWKRSTRWPKRADRPKIARKQLPCRSRPGASARIAGVDPDEAIDAEAGPVVSDAPQLTTEHCLYGGSNR